MHHIIHAVRKEFSAHLFDYLLFFTAGIFFLLGLYVFRGERLLEFIVLIAFVAFYLIWSTYHHIIENSLRVKVMLEYILIGFTVLFLVKLLLIP